MEIKGEKETDNKNMKVLACRFSAAGRLYKKPILVSLPSLPLSTNHSKICLGEWARFVKNSAGYSNLSRVTN
jgi:hypothetical protein